MTESFNPKSPENITAATQIEMDADFFHSIRDEVFKDDMSYITEAYLVNSHNLTEIEATAVLKQLQSDGNVSKESRDSYGYAVYKEGIDKRELTDKEKRRNSVIGRTALSPIIQIKQYAHHNFVSRPQRYIANPAKNIKNKISGSSKKDAAKQISDSDQKINERWNSDQSIQLSMTESSTGSVETEKQRRASERAQRDEAARKELQDQKEKYFQSRKNTRRSDTAAISTQVSKQNEDATITDTSSLDINTGEKIKEGHSDEQNEANIKAKEVVQISQITGDSIDIIDKRSNENSYVLDAVNYKRLKTNIDVISAKMLNDIQSQHKDEAIDPAIKETVVVKARKTAANIIAEEELGLTKDEKKTPSFYAFRDSILRAYDSFQSPQPSESKDTAQETKTEPRQLTSEQLENNEGTLAERLEAVRRLNREQ